MNTFTRLFSKTINFSFFWTIHFLRPSLFFSKRHLFSRKNFFSSKKLCPCLIELGVEIYGIGLPEQRSSLYICVIDSLDSVIQRYHTFVPEFWRKNFRIYIFYPYSLIWKSNVDTFNFFLKQFSFFLSLPVRVHLLNGVKNLSLKRKTLFSLPWNYPKKKQLLRSDLPVNPNIL